MARYDFYQYLETIPTKTDNILYYDFISVNWTDFPYQDTLVEHTMSATDCDRFYNISNFYYGSTNYSDILFLINGLTDPFTLKPGTKIKIPSQTDILRIKNLFLNPTSNDSNKVIL